MLILSCRVGSTVRIGEDTRITVHARLGQRVTFGVQAPAHVDLRLDDTVLRPAPLPEGDGWYLFSLLGVRVFRVGAIEVRLCARAGDHAEAAGDHVHLALLDADGARIRLVEPPLQANRVWPFLRSGLRDRTRSLAQTLRSGVFPRHS
ncbi:MAG: carbon storage regulator [Lysobacteraceae bacterium]